MKRAILFAGILLACCITITAQSNTAALLPMPRHVTTDAEGRTFRIKESTVINAEFENAEFITTRLAAIIEERTGIALSSGSRRSNVIEVAIDTTLQGREHYTIDVNRRGIYIIGATEGALFLALQTIDQILLGDVCNTAKGEVEYISIDDNPRYPLRAMMLDPARHFIPTADVKFFIDQMARFKFNTLQLHLTDDQGWRIEIKSHPELVEAGAFRKEGGSPQGPDNGFYTQEEIKEIIEYAAQRNIEVIPELDIPGHSAALLTAHPELGCPFRHEEHKELGTTTNMMLCAANEEVYALYEDIIREVARLFPSQKIHLGGDEAAIAANWAKCNDCLAMLDSLGYENPEQLMIPFFNNILDIVRRNGKEAILWCELDNIWPPANEYLFPYPSDVTLVTWRNALTPKCIELTREHGHSLIMAPGEYAYLDYPQYPGDLPEFNNWGMPVTTLEQTYSLDPGYGLPQEEQQHITGVMATLWGEAIKDINRVTYMAFPRAMAIAEAAWSYMPQRSWESFKERIYPNITDMMKRGVSVRVPFEIVERKQ